MTTTIYEKRNNFSRSMLGQICNEKVSGEEIILKRGNLKRLTGVRQGDMVRCLEGEVWVTQELDIKDYVFGPGGGIFITLPGVVVVQALKDSRIEMVSPLKTTSYRGKYPVFH